MYYRLCIVYSRALTWLIEETNHSYIRYITKMSIVHWQHLHRLQYTIKCVLFYITLYVVIQYIMYSLICWLKLFLSLCENFQVLYKLFITTIYIVYIKIIHRLRCIISICIMYRVLCFILVEVIFYVA